MAAVVVKEQTLASPNGRVRERYAEPTMTRAARRRATPEAWRFDLEALYHYTAEYPYDPGHEYEADWTTDPDYGIEGIHLCKFDAAGVELMADNRAREIQRTAGNTAFDKLGDCVELKTGVHYMTPDGVVRWVFADLMVLPQVNMLGMATGPDRALRLHQGDPPPALVLEILSYGGAQRDLDGKLRLYANLGIRGYLVYDLGGKRRKESPRELLLYRLKAGGYEQVEPLKKASASGPEVHWSDVFGANIRMRPDPREEFSVQPGQQRPALRFQWWDEGQDRWHDHQTDEEVEREQAEQETLRRHARELRETLKEGEARGRELAQTEMAVDLLHKLLSELPELPLDQIAAVWHRDGAPADAVDCILAVRQAPHEWRSLLLPDSPDHGGGLRWGPLPGFQPP